MIGSFSILLIFAGILFIASLVMVFWIWKNKNWSNIKRGVLTIILTAGLLAAVYASFGLILIFSDQSGDFTTHSNLGEIDYDEIISNAKKAGYEVDGPYYFDTKDTIGVHPSNIKELDERFGEDYISLSAKYYYRENVYFSTWYSESGTDISFYNEDRPDTLAPFKLDDLPPDEWIIEKFRLMFDITEQESIDYLTQLKDSIGNSPEESGKINIRKGLDIAAVYSNLKEASTNSHVSPTSGKGWITETFYSQDKKIGVLDFLIPNTRIILHDNEHEYTIRIDRLGGVSMEINLGAGEQISGEEYRRIFKDMFVNLGLPAEKVDDFEFDF